ncbi:hypothetical protein ENSA5_51060 [Enhygromyxa salina]|uniref:Uncharacterized protein n=1 Tax=Enhygromyxa salina TaxID=215803 RepID=A0A2S9XH15_9BACT|nr:hypothetical protein [Enhygromyxa salina]PRP92159.1 hypothetical protein ENSA5_51060 [Enhygromyxa salina]
MTTVVFASPRRLPKPHELAGRVVVVDIAFASEGIGKGFRKTTGKFIEQLGPRLARWVDHHDHPAHASFAADERFVLATKAEHGACPEMIDERLVRETGPIDTIVAHFDLDGLYAAAKWLLGGREPYPGADDDARAVDTRIGPIGPEAAQIDKALRAHYRDEVLKQQILRYLVEGMRPGLERSAIEAAAADYDRMAARSAELAQGYAVDGEIAFVKVPGGAGQFDKTELLLLGQKLATVAVVADGGNVSIAAPFDSGLDFVELLELGGGMPTRVNVPAKRLDQALERIAAALRERS